MKRTPKYLLKATPKYSIKRVPKKYTKSRITTTLFIDTVMDEVELRHSHGNTLIKSKKAIRVRYSKMLTKMAMNVLTVAKELEVPAINLLFLFLNRHYPLYLRHAPLAKMTFIWDEFLIDLEQERHLITLLNYDHKQKNKICDIIQQIPDIKKSKKLKTFLSTKAQGYRLILPEHCIIRSKMFETILVMLQQLKDNNLSYYESAHFMEVVQAHTIALQKFGNPIKLSLGHFIGDIAIFRLKNYINNRVSTYNTPIKKLKIIE